MSQLSSAPAEVIQSAQTALGKLQMQYRDSQIEFYALGVAWEAARFAWYVVNGDRDTAADKLRLLDDWIATYRRRVSLVVRGSVGAETQPGAPQADDRGSAPVR